MVSQPNPELSVVLVISINAREAAKTLHHLSQQTIADRIELILVAADEAALAGVSETVQNAFHDVQTVKVGPIDDVEAATYEGLQRSSAPYVAFVEDHAFPSEDWAAKTLHAHKAGYDVVGTQMRNANPASPFSWGNMLLAYGPWLEPARYGEVESVQGHNVSFSRAALDQFGENLIAKMRREGGLMTDLRANGAKFFLTETGRIAHVNPSSLASTTALRFDSGRLYGAARAEKEQWSPVKRAAYIAGGPLIPFIRLVRLRRDYFGENQRGEERQRAYVGMIYCLVMDALGQMTGYALGPGKAGDRLATFELGRHQHLTAKDRQRLAQ
jgi:hypothetical protein